MDEVERREWSHEGSTLGRRGTNQSSDPVRIRVSEREEGMKGVVRREEHEVFLAGFDNADKVSSVDFFPPCFWTHWVIPPRKGKGNRSKQGGGGGKPRGLSCRI